MVQAGMLIKGEARMPRSMVKPSGLFTRKARMLRPDAIAQWNVNNAKLLKTFGLKIAAVEDMELCPAVREAGPFEVLLSQRATLGAALPAVGLSFEARGSLLELAPDLRKGAKGEHKEGADLWASSAELEVLYTVVEENPDIAFLVQVGEGAGDADRRKPGEGLNASLYPGQLIVNQQHAGVPVEGLPGRGVTVLEIATDPIDGTTKTVMFDHSAVTSLLIVNGKIRRVPDVYMEKLTVDQVAANSGLDTDEPLDKIVQGLADTHEALPHQLNGFHLLRGERHPTQHLLGLGLNIVGDTDGDMVPGVSPGARPGVYENDLPINAMLGDLGGAAEYLIAAAANQMLGGASHGKFVSGENAKAGGWDARHEYTVEDRRIIEGAGFQLGKNYPIGQLVDLKDGIVVFGGITSNAHFPYLRGVFLGDNFAQVDVVRIGSSGRMIRRRFTFTFEQPIDKVRDNFEPVTEVLMKCDLADIRGETKRILRNPKRAARLRREIGLSLYQVFDLEGDKFRVNDKKLAELGDERTKAIVETLTTLAPDWFA